ncbi:MAG TPA: PHP domain-containing protein [Streptosporangiaceae bacterium]|nr:PHP domain-containing protein [Streptosporangiaceae bacterium]
MTIRVALDEDYHVHSTFSDGASTLAQNVRVARERRLRTLCLADHVRRDTLWVPDFVAAVSAYRSLSQPRVLAGLEAKILDSSGRLDIPPGLGCVDAVAGIDIVLIADHRFPGDHGPVHPAEMRAAIDGHDVTAQEAIECLVEATVYALAAAPHALVAHLFSLLPKIGLDEDQVPPLLLDHLAKRIARADALVEVNEKWRCPSARTVAALARADVRLVAGSDSHHCEHIAGYDSVIQTVRAGRVPCASGQVPC